MDYALVAGGTCAATTLYAAGGTCTVLFTFTPSHPWVRYGSVTLADSTGRLLGNSFLTGTGTGPQISYPANAGAVPSQLGSGFTTPQGIAVDGMGNVYVADAASNKVNELIAVGGFVPASPTIVTLGSGFSAPSGVAVDGAGNVYVADTGNNFVKELIAVGGAVPATNPTVILVGSGYSAPTGVAVDGSGNVYVADSNNNAIEEVVAVNGVIPTGATPVTLSAAFSIPTGVAVDAGGNVYVADSNNSAVKEMVAVSGSIPASPTIKSIGSGFLMPYGIALDGSGDLYVADTGNNAVKEIVAVGGTFPATPSILTLGSGFTTPHGVAVDGSGNIFVADTSTVAKKLNDQTPPALVFASTAVGLTSTDSPQSVTIANTGNAVLNFTIPGAGTNPSVAVNFSFSNSSTCPSLTSTSSPTSLPVGATCTEAVSFVPLQAGSISGSLTTTDNNLNAAATQSLALSGTGSHGALVVNVAPATAVVNASPIPLSAMVAYGGVIPTGPFTFTVNGGGSIPATCTSSGSPMTCSANYIPTNLAVAGSPYPVNFSAAIDTNYNGTSGNGTLTITQGTPTLALASSGTANVNSVVMLTATVTAPITGIVPTGSVTFTSTLGGVTSNISGCVGLPLTSPKATCQTNALTANSYTIGARIAADNNFQAASATPIPQSITPEPATLSLPATGSSTVNGSVTFTATLSATAFTPTVPSGKVSFSLNGNPVAACSAVTLNASDQATCTLTSLVAPSDTITATYSNDSNFTAAGPATQSQIVSQNTPVISIVSSAPANALVNQSVTFTAAVTPAGAGPGGVLPVGNVTFTQGATVLCGAVAVSGSAATGTSTASCGAAFSNVVSGTTITATYSGDVNFKAGTPGTVTQTVLAAPSATKVTSNLSSVGINQSVNLTATVTAAPGNTGAATPQTGTVTFVDSLDGSTFCVGNLTGGVVPTCSHVFNSLGTHTITATFASSDPNFNGTNTTVTGAPIVVGGSNTTIAVSQTAGTATPATVDLSGDQFQAALTNFPTNLPGTLTYSDNGNVVTGAGCTIASVPSNGNIPSACAIIFTSVGTHQVTATFTPTTGTPLTSSPVVVTIGQTATSLTFTAPSATVNAYATYQAAVSVVGSSVPPGTTPFTGSVTFTDAATSTPICTATTFVAATGVASCQGILYTGGNHSVTASFGSDTNFTSTSQNVIAAVGMAKPTVALSNSPTVVATQSLPITVTVTATTPLGTPVTPTGAVTITVPNTSGSSPYTCSPLVATASPGQSTCTLPVSFLSSINGAQAINATYNGDGNYTAVGAAASSVTVQNFTAAVTLSPASSTLKFAQGSTTQGNTNAGNTNLSDLYNPVTIQYAVSGISGFSDTSSVTSCSVTPATPGLSCTPNGTGAVTTATSGVPAGNSYSLTLTVTDSQNTGLSHTTPAFPFTITNVTSTVFLSSIGTGSANFTAPAGQTSGSSACGTQVATASSPNGPYTVTRTLASINVVCDAFTSTGSGTYTFTMRAGTQTNARLGTGAGSGRTVLACFGAPFLLLIGLLPGSKKLRKAALRGLAILVAGIMLMQVSGCSTGGFVPAQGTRAVDGYYLINVVNAQGATIAEVPFTITN
jgi:sugar lactone lactonase YvrE